MKASAPSHKRTRERDRRVRLFCYFAKRRDWDFCTLDDDSVYDKRHIRLRTWTDGKGTSYALMRVAYSKENVVEIRENFTGGDFILGQYRDPSDLYHVLDREGHVVAMVWYPSYLGGALDISMRVGDGFNCHTEKYPDISTVINIIKQRLGIVGPAWKEVVSSSAANAENYKVFA